MRAADTAKLILQHSGMSTTDAPLVVDERLREREFGVLDRLTKLGIKERFPEQAEFRGFLGKFYHRPPGGESWADVVLRLRSWLDTVQRECTGERLLVVTHQVVVLMFRYIFEHLDEPSILAIDRAQELANCSLTSFSYDESAGPGRRGGMVLSRFNDVVAIDEDAKAEVTTEPDVRVVQRPAPPA